MSDLATIADVESRWRPLQGRESTNAQSWLADASGILRDDIPDVDDRCADSQDYARKVAYVIAMAVVRVLRGQDPRDPADYSTIFFTKAELAGLSTESAATAAFTITPWSDGPGYRTDSPLESWV